MSLSKGKIFPKEQLTFDIGLMPQAATRGTKLDMDEFESSWLDSVERSFERSVRIG
jgi:hypothetical protein